MKLLVDVCAGLRLAQALQSAGHEVDFVGDWPRDPGDEEILRCAHERASVLITRDKDFGTLAVLRNEPHYGILRLVELLPGREISLCLSVLEKHEADLQRGCLITVEAHRIRIREPGHGKN